MAHLHDSVRTLYGVGTALEERLERLGIRTLHDLIWYFPRQYEDRSDIITIAEVKPDAKVTISARVAQIRSRRAFRRRRMHIVEALLSDDSGSIAAVWFNQPYIAKQLRVGDQLLFSGIAKSGKHGFALQNPVYERSQPGKETTHTGRIVPNYALTEGITQKQLRALVKQALTSALGEVEDPFPDEMLRRYDVEPLASALQELHFPASGASFSMARKRLEFQELYFVQLQAQRIRQALHAHRSPEIPFHEAAIKQFVQQLPFTLTTAQRKAAWTILKDMQNGVPMNRLLSGDVGSGKTVVAAIAMLNVVRNGLQAVLMVPTEILAQQHAASLEQLFAGNAVTLALLTSRTRKQTNVQTADVIVGTHAVIQDAVVFPRLGLVVVDEQHRFGVQQRQQLKKQTRGGDMLPHLLSMTATPIPRTLALTMYGDLDLSVIDELPKGRLTIKTNLVPPEKRADAYDFIRTRVNAGEQCFVICPLIEPSDVSGAKSVTTEYDRLRTEVFPDLRIAMVHGKMKSDEKEQIMQRMKQKKIDVLVSTSVIEVGVDIPHATIMMIEGAERFGLAQLHQFRGRVGRSDMQSYCLLFTGSSADQTLRRLRALTKIHNGFQLAELDMKQRGTGEIYGTLQSGFSQSLITFQNPQLIGNAQAAAKDTLAYGWLDSHPQLQRAFSEFTQNIHFE